MTDARRFFGHVNENTHADSCGPLIQSQKRPQLTTPTPLRKRGRPQKKVGKETIIETFQGATTAANTRAFPKQQPTEDLIQYMKRCRRQLIFDAMAMVLQDVSLRICTLEL